MSRMNETRFNRIKELLGSTGGNVQKVAKRTKWSETTVRRVKKARSLRSYQLTCRKI